MIVMEWLSYDEGECVKYKKSPKYVILLKSKGRDSSFVHTVCVHTYVLCMYVYHEVSIHIIHTYLLVHIICTKDLFPIVVAAFGPCRCPFDPFEENPINDDKTLAHLKEQQQYLPVE